MAVFEIDAPVYDDDEEGTWRKRMPSMVLPFAIVCGSAALFTVLGLGWEAESRFLDPWLPAAIATGLGGIIGLVFRHWKQLTAPLSSRDALAIRVGFVIVSAGAIVGGITGAREFPRSDTDAKCCALFGAILAMMFIPSALVVLAAARRAARARLGTIVAAADRRTIYATLLAAVAFAAGLQAPAFAVGGFSTNIAIGMGWSFALGAFVQFAMSVVPCTGAVFVIGMFLRRDQRARELLLAHGPTLRDLERTESVWAAEEEEEERDLGLGRERWVRRTEIATYRSVPKLDVVLRGSLTEALAALDENIARRRRSLVVACLALAILTWSFPIGAAVARAHWAALLF
jgi:hypothetical protein